MQTQTEIQSAPLMTEAERLLYRKIYESDPWEFALDIAGCDLLVERFHKPLIYLLTRQTKLLIETLRSSLQSVFITKLKKALSMKGLDWRRDSHFPQIAALIRKLNLRMARKLGKTTCALVAILWMITVDPNQAWALVSRDDDAAEEMCSYIGEIVRGPVYRFFFPDRVPDDERVNLTQSYIMLKGRTRRMSQPHVTAKGYDSGWTSKHFTGVNGDDLVGLENRTPVKLKGVRDFQANVGGLKLEIGEFVFFETTIGTRWARLDDSAAPESDPDCLTLYVMIEDRAEPVTFKNMLQAGEPVLKEWFDKPKIAAEKREYLKDKDAGSLALLANLFLTIPSQAAAVFNSEDVEEAVFQWVKDKDNPKKRLIRRPVWEPDGRLARDKDGKTTFIIIDPARDLEIKMGGDPAASMTGDEYGWTVLGRDSFGVRYQLETVAGHGAVGFMDAAIYLDKKWNPDQVGIESAAMQDFVRIAMSRDEHSQSLANKFVGVPHKNRSKRERAYNLVAGPLAMRELLRNPEDAATASEMVDWDPDAKNPKDARIDSLGIGMYLFDTPAVGMTEKEIAEMAARDDAAYEASLDPDFGLPVESLNLDSGDDVISVDDLFDDWLGAA